MAPHFQAQHIATAKDVDALATLVVPHTDLENASQKCQGVKYLYWGMVIPTFHKQSCVYIKALL